MDEVTLRALYEQHQGKLSDKWLIYLSEYDRLFTPYRNRSLRLLEIGVQNGGSLEIWGWYFRAAERIVGCDINPDCARLKYADSRISVVVGDANSDAAEQEIASRSERYDLIIDDGSHTSTDIIRSFARYFPRLEDGGLFVAEDLHCSYWQGFDGGVFDPGSSVAFFKRLADILNYEHWGIQKTRKELISSFMHKYGVDIDEELLARLHSIEFINSLCVVRKEHPSANVIGPRFIAGTDEAVASGHLGLHLTPAPKPNQESNPWSVRQRLPEDELAWAGAELARQAAELESLRLTAARSESLNASLRSSLSQCELQLQQLLEKVARMAR